MACVFRVPIVMRISSDRAGDAVRQHACIHTFTKYTTGFLGTVTSAIIYGLS